ncbi:phage portal protein [Promicromonospora iranensis]|uniref:SPP1 Gp6-like portal protein n=1 Tax=Promicromonospora iranensis TaxID=1105144 RepID=A0ABU2CV53_9MICO|nr:phage portal protein [Promicromonospora iranensis]MDR7385221.1 hypothetical protein [Promicromonospora iranensis]
MPLPQPNQVWPPKALTAIRPKLEEWDAWYQGDPGTLTRVYTGRDGSASPKVRPSQNAGGVVGALSRFWWGRPVKDLTQQRRAQIHLPIAADLARVSADLLYSEPPRLTIGDEGAKPGQGKVKKSTPTQDRLLEYVDDGFHEVLATGAEVGAALGGRYHRVTWDQDILQRPFLTTVDADAAWPEFRWGRLVGVTFWHVVADDGKTVRRHLERHELDGQGIGITLHGLYEGTTDNLGRLIPLDKDDATKPLAQLVDGDGAIVAGRTPGLAVAYTPNQTPSRVWRSDPIGKNLGRSDYDQCEPFFDAADEAYSSLMRDVRLAKARIIVPSYMLDSNGVGRGTSFDGDREVYEGVNVPPSEEGSRAEITPQQFDIRVEEHLAVIDDQVQRIISTAGYSAQTLSDGFEGGGTMTATEVQARERRSYLTRDRKIRHERPALLHLVRKMLDVDTAVFSTPELDGTELRASFADTVQDSALVMAQTVQALETARAASTETKVRMMHPDWEPEMVKAEVALILSETGAPLADPFAIGQQEEPEPTPEG